MTTIMAMAFGLMGLSFGRLGAQRKATASGGGTPIAGTPTFYIYGF